MFRVVAGVVPVVGSASVLGLVCSFVAGGVWVVVLLVPWVVVGSALAVVAASVVAASAVASAARVVRALLVVVWGRAGVCGVVVVAPGASAVLFSVSQLLVSWVGVLVFIVLLVSFVVVPGFCSVRVA